MLTTQPTNHADIFPDTNSSRSSMNNIKQKKKKKKIIVSIIYDFPTKHAWSSITCPSAALSKPRHARLSRANATVKAIHVGGHGHATTNQQLTTYIQTSMMIEQEKSSK